MASGTITGSFSGGTSSSRFTYKLIWSSSIYDVATRQSKVTLSWYVVCSASGYATYKLSTPWTKTVDGTTTSGTAAFNSSQATLTKNANTLFRSETIYITHDADGTKSVSISGTMDLSGTSAGTGSLSGTMVLDQIAVTPPTATGLTLSDSGTGYSTVGVYVSGFTKLSFSASATAGDADIASYAFYRDSTLLGTVSTSATTVTLTMTSTEPSGSYVYSVVVTDTAGNSDTYALSAVTIYAYTMPTISASTYRCDSSGNQDNDGTYGRVYMDYSVAAVGSNTATVHKVTINGSDYTTFPAIVSGLATTNTYTAVYVVTDSLGTSATITQYVQVSFINFDLYPSSQGGGAAFGEAAQQDKLIVNESETILRGDLTVEGDASAENLTLTNPLPIAQGGTGQTAVTTTALTITASNTSQISAISGSYARYGKIIDLVIDFTTAASLAANGGATFNFTVTGLPTPALGTYLRSWSMSSAKMLELFISADGSSCGIRNLRASAAAAGTFESARFIYIEA